MMPQPWRFPFALTLFALLATTLIYSQTALFISHTWVRSETYAHGFLVFPICAYLIWRKRHELVPLTPRPTLLAFPFLMLLAIVWFAGNLADVQVIQQATFVFMIPALALTILGTAVCRVLLFPLAYLVFAIPTGEELIPPLQDWTAWFTVKGLQLSGIPVYLEGRYLTIPTGTWEIAKACAGLRYIIPSLTLGTFFAAVTYKTWTRQALFILASALVPILANGLRAYFIILLAYLSDNQLAVGVDHFIYGWVFFGIIMFGMFTIGLRWREPSSPKSNEDLPSTSLPRQALSPQNLSAGTSSAHTRRHVLYAFTAVIILALGPLIANRLGQAPTIPIHVNQVSFDTRPPWVATDENLQMWKPQLSAANAEIARTFQAAQQQVNLYVALYTQERQGGELINTTHDVINRKFWQQMGEGKVSVRLGRDAIQADSKILRSGFITQQIWHWYWIGGTFTSNPYYAKWLQLKARVGYGHPGAAFVAISTNYDETTPQGAQTTLQSFLDHLNDPLNRSLLNSIQ